MKSLAKFAQLDQKGPWAFLGWVVAVISLAVSGYLYYLSQQRPAIEARLVSGVLLNQNKPVEGLKVSYNGSNLNDTGKNISLVTALITNCGNTTIRQSDFDPQHRFGICVPDGILLGVPEVVVPSSRHFLERNLDIEPGTVSHQEGGTLQRTECPIAPFLMDPGEYFSLQLLILHERNEVPCICFMGKIAGVKEIPVWITAEMNPKRAWSLGLWYGMLSTGMVSLIAMAILTWRFTRIFARHFAEYKAQVDSQHANAMQPDVAATKDTSADRSNDPAFLD